MTAPKPPAPNSPGITIGVRRYHATTGKITTVRAPRFHPGTVPNFLVGDRFPMCECVPCRAERRENHVR